ncbi:protein PYRICULARIA ORYZAE RESISTANCE 21 [Triticum aestivum]|uniref:protein PYRICULARIA ORYZAE RESISTANCE 21 n=1 Tax=Triticum aestivum TaxID=4565 RepID=UPI001D02FB3A|nr:protein PYRICULARIA ORYZAE RESISTANCE 21-like [Triticum aestivum]
MVSMAAAKLAVLLAVAALFAVAEAANPQEAHCWQCYYSCMQQKCGGYRNPAAHTAVDDGTAAASVPLNSTDGTTAVVHPADGGAAAHVAGGYESYCKCNKACILDCYKALPPVCYQMCVSETCSKLPPCKQAECYKACGDKCYHKQPSPGPKPPSPKPNPGPKPPSPKPTPPKPAPPNHGGSPKPTPPKPTPPNHGGSPKPTPPKPTPPDHGGSPKPKPPRPTPPKRPCPPHAPKPKPKPKPCPPKPKPKPPCPCPPAADGSASTDISNN